MSPVNDRQLYRQLMYGAGLLEDSQQHWDALNVYARAFNAAEPGSFDQGDAARANYYEAVELNWPEKSTEWADRAYQIHGDLAEAYPNNHIAVREKAISGVEVAMNGVRAAVRLEARGLAPDRTNEFWVGFMRDSLEELDHSKVNAPRSLVRSVARDVSRYKADRAAEISISESLYGDSKRGRSIGIKAVASAMLSRSPKTNTLTPELGSKDRNRPRLAALKRGFAALGVNVLAAPEWGIRRKLAIKIAATTLNAMPHSLENR